MSSEKFDKLRKTLHFLENPLYPSVGPHLYLLSFIGLWNPTTQKTNKFKQFMFFISISFFISQYVKCILKFDSDSLKLILQYAAFHVGIVKACYFRKNHKLWEKLIGYTAKIESQQFDQRDKFINNEINAYIYRNRRVTYFFWTLAIFANFSIFSEPYLKNQVVENGTSIYLYIFDGYTPFKKEPPGYYISMLIQTILGYVISAYVVSWDTLVVSIMIFFAGQLTLARFYCHRVIVSGDKERSHRNIANFHHYYINLIRYQRLFNKLISPIMFVYLIVISVNLGMLIIQIIAVKNDLGALLASVLYIIACLVQLLLFYWHSNEVTIESSLLSFSAYESNWIGADLSTQKEIALLCCTTTKRMVFDAGPYNKMSLPTFVSILRTSYSFYTLMNGTNK